MRLSDVRGERTLDVIADLIEPVASVAQDEAFSEMFDSKGRPEGMSSTQYFAARVRKSLPKLIKGHRDEIVAILATIKGVTPAQYAEDMTLSSLFADVYELMTDEEFLTFLSSQEKAREPSGTD